MTTTITSTIKPTGGGNYTSLNTWEADRRGDITAVGRDTIEVAEVYSGGNAITTNFTFYTVIWHTDYDHYIEIRAAVGHRHSGVYDESKAFLATRYPMIDSLVGASFGGYPESYGYLKLRNMQFKNNHCEYSLALRGWYIVADSCLILGGAAITCDTVRYSVFKNCIIHGHSTYGIRLNTNNGVWGTKIKFLNCMISSLYIDQRTFDCTLKNCYVGNWGIDTQYSEYIGHLYVDNTVATSNAQAPNVNLRNISFDVVNFRKIVQSPPYLSDFRLISGSNLIGSGSDLSGDSGEEAVTVDITGSTRKVPFDIGPFNYSAFPVLCSGAFDNPVCWEKISEATVGHSSSLSPAMTPTYVYYVDADAIIRYDRSKSWTSASSWESVLKSDVGLLTVLGADELNWGSNGGIGHCYDGRYLYFAPRYTNPTPLGGVNFVRFDTQGAFNSSGSWQQMPLIDLDVVYGPMTWTIAGAFVGLTYLNGYIYYAPHGASHFVQYNTAESFTNPNSYKSIMRLTVGNGKFFNCSHDNRYIYYFPYDGTKFVRYDTQGTFSDIDSWEIILESSIFTPPPLGEGPIVAHYYAGAFDGRYIYVSMDDGSTDTREGGNKVEWAYIMRYDTTLPFTSGSSWERIAPHTVNMDMDVHFSHFRYPYVYGYTGLLGPDTSSAYIDVIRYDTTLPFASPSSWQKSYFTQRSLCAKGSGLSDGVDPYIYYISGSDFGRWNTNGDIPVCWNYTARYKSSNRLFKASGCGSFPKNLRVPSNVDVSTGRMVDDGIFINPDEYKVI